MARPKKIVVGIGWYRPQDWARLREISVDRDNLEATHAEWVVQANRVVRQLEETGQACDRIVVDPEELLAWCRAHGCPVDGAARSRFVSEKVSGKPQEA